MRQLNQLTLCFYIILVLAHMREMRNKFASLVISQNNIMHCVQMLNLVESNRIDLV